MGITKCVLTDIGSMPEWAKFFITIGKILYRDSKISKSILKIVVTMPTQSEIPALLAGAGIGDSIFKGTNEHKDYAKIFESIEIGQVLYYMNNDVREICTFQGMTYNEVFNQRAIRLKFKKYNMELIEDRWLQIQLGEQKEYKRDRKIKGNGLASKFLNKIYDKDILDKVKLIEGMDYHIIGNVKKLERISDDYTFTYNSNKKGKINDFIRAKSICPSHDYTHSKIVSKRSGEKTVNNDYENEVVIFTDASSYLNKEEIYRNAFSLVCISRLDNSENLQDVEVYIKRYLRENQNQIVTQHIVELIKKKVEIPQGIEILAWREEKLG